MESLGQPARTSTDQPRWYSSCPPRRDSLLANAGEPHMTPDEFFEGHEASRRLYEAVVAVMGRVGPAEVRITKSQIAFRRKRSFAWVWRPGRYLRAKVAPLVLSVSLDHRDQSTRWKQIVEPAPGHFMHHLELPTTMEIDEDVLRWLRERRGMARADACPEMALPCRAEASALQNS